MSDTRERWSQPAENWLEEFNDALVCDVLVVGSGYGGSFAALALAQPNARVWVVERGQEHVPGTFAQGIGELPAHVRMSRGVDDPGAGNADALMDFRRYADVSVLLGSGLGGGSLINAGVAVAPDPTLLIHPAWPAHYRLHASHRKALEQTMAEVQQQLQAYPFLGAQQLRKFQALDTLGRAMGESARRLPLTIASTDQTSPAGIDQKACTRCGNCFTGCNVGAKNTLVTHVLPDAVRKGARLVTGATALEVQRLPDASGTTPLGRPLRWRVRMVVTQSTGHQSSRREFWVSAHTVVVAAGALGSTELLLRSSTLKLSPRLGQGFSTNGDVLALGWGMASPVHGMASEDEEGRPLDQRVGPTITGVVSPTLDVDGQRRRVFIEEGAVPSALTQAVLALGATLSLPHRYTHSRPPGYFRQAGSQTADPLATPQEMARHALLLLGMGLDDADGNVTLEPEDGHLLMQVSWPAGAKGPRSPYYQALHRWLLDARDADGFDGGDYLPSPLWKPLPDDFEEIAGGAMQPQGLTVHPLGGCGMGDSVDTGVVDWRGTVFHADGSLLEGLHVLDGAMLPTAVGVNPFVTISALSWLAARDMQRQLELQPTVPTHLDTVHSHLPHFREQPRKAPRRATQTAEPLLLRFHEHLQGRWDGVRPVWLPPTPRDWSDPEKAREWVVSVEVQLDVSQWLADPAMRLAAHMRVFQNTHPHEISVRPEATRGVPVMEGNGWVSLLARDAPDGLVGEGWRMALAVAAFLQRRTMSEAFNLLSPKDASDVPADRTVQPPPKTVLQRVAGFARAARNHAQYRTLDYEFVLHAAGDSSQVLPLHGSKRLAYAPSEKNPWDALVQIELVMNAPQVRGALVVEADLIDMVRRRRLQVLQAPDTPAAIIGLAGFSALWLRSLFQTHFWSFRGLDYARLRPPPPARHGPLWPQGQDGLPCQPAVEKLMVPRRVPGQTQGAAEAPLQLELTRYSPAPANDPVKHLLMIHGLAHGATVFSTDTTGGRNMAAAFLADGYTVWLLDHRLSNRLGSTDAQGRWHGYAVQDHCMDDLARLDIAAAVTHVHRAAGQPIDVFAHCVGAGAFAMATLRGWLNDEEGHSRVRAALIHAVHPWVVPSASNQLSGELAALYRDFLPKDRSVNPVPPSGVGGAMDQVLDRVAASLPWPPQEMKAHLAHQFDEAAGTATCNRMTLFYGREWVHANLAEETHRQLASLVGPASVAVFQQLYHLVNRQHLTDRYGAEVYMREDQFNAHWQFPVMFCHGTENRVFDPRAAARSWHQLRMLQERQPRPDLPGRVVRLFMAEGYGHMDFLFGRDAHRDVYPSLVAFLRDPCAFEGTFDTDSGSAAACHARVPRIWRDHTPGAAVAPLTGPMLQLDHDGERRVLVIWVEMPNEPWQGQLSPMLQAVQGSLVTALAGWQATRLGGVYPPGGLQREVPLLQGPGAYWVIRLTEAPDQPFERLSLLQLAWANVGAEGVGSADDSMKPALIDLTRLPWWRAWVQSPSAAPAGNGVSWLATSCRWPGTPFERDAVDAVAARMLTHVQHPTHPVHALVMLGDQIYADATANLFTTQPDDEKLAQFYRDAWGSPHARELLAQLPAYFVVDDHEICDNWNGSLHPSDDETLLMGFEAALAYQWRWTDATRHAPQVTQRRVRGFWRTFQIGQLPAFAADTRTERQPRTAANWRHARMISATQMTALEQWLLQHRDQPKVLCSGSVLGWVEHALVRAPQQGVSSDSWGGFPASWRRLVRFIVRHQIRHIIFLTGDYHFSGVAELTLHADAGLPPVQAQSVVCSGWNASLPFANGSPGDYVTDSNVELPGSDGSARIVSHATTMGTALRQFSKLTVRQLTEGEWTLRVDVSGEGGELLARTDRRL